MKKLVLIALVAVGVAAFVGTDVIRSSVGSVRTAVRDALTAEVPLPNQLAEAQAQVDAYAESIIRGEVAAENLRDMISGVEREVRGLTVRVDRERDALATLRDGLAGGEVRIVPTSLAPQGSGLAQQDTARHRQGALRRVRAFEAANELLERRHADLARLQEEYGSTRASLEEARSEQARLAEEVRVLAAEIESLQARKAAARTRNAVGDASIAGSGFAEAQGRIREIRSRLSEQNKLLQYYEYERVVRVDATAGAVLHDAGPTDPVTAIDAALAAYPSSGSRASE